MGCSPWGHRESGSTEYTCTHVELVLRKASSGFTLSCPGVGAVPWGGGEGVGSLVSCSELGSTFKGHDKPREPSVIRCQASC